MPHTINQSWREQIESNWIGARVGLWDTTLKFLSPVTSQITWSALAQNLSCSHSEHQKQQKKLRRKLLKLFWGRVEQVWSPSSLRRLHNMRLLKYWSMKTCCLVLFNYYYLFIILRLMKVQGVFLKSSTLSWVVQNTDLAFQKQWKALKKHRKSCSLRIQTVIHAPPCLSFAG